MRNVAPKLIVAFGLALAAATGSAGAAESYPSRPVRLVVPLFAGAGTDIIAGTMASSLAKRACAVRRCR